MKKLVLNLAILCVLMSQNNSIAQGGTAGNTRLFPAQFLGWNTLGINGPLNIRNDFNNRINFATTGFTRMFIDNGVGGQTNGRVAIGNALPSFLMPPADRLTLYEAATTGSVQIRFQNTSTGVSATDGYAIGVENDNTTPNNRVVNHTQFERRQMRWLLPDSRQAGFPVKEWMRIQNNPLTPSTLNAFNTTDGYLGLNNPAPDFHIDAITPAINGLELFNSFRTSDVPNSRMGMCNGTTFNNNIIPTFFGTVDGSQTNPGLQTIASITSAQDVATNKTPVTRFRSGKDWVPNAPGGIIVDLSEIENRYAFSWMNGLTTKMHMTARGEIRIGDNLLSGSPVNISPPRNRLEISADVTDPYGAVIPTNGASGIRLTYLTALKTPLTTNPGTGVLSVDTAGNIIYVPANAGGSALGNICGATTNPLTNDWEIPLNTHNFLFGGQGTSNYNVGIGTTCSPAAKLDILEVSGTNATIALNVINKDLYGIGINVAAVKGPFGVYSVASLADPVTLRTIGVYGEANDFNAIKGNFGIYGVAKNNATQDNIGGFFDATSSVVNNTGMRAYANNASSSNIGGQFQAISSVSGPFATIQNIGVSTLAFGPNPIANIALYAQVDINRPQDYAGWFDGAVNINGVGTINGGSISSDQLFKTSIDTITNATSIINSLKPKQFYYDTNNVYGMNFSNKKQYGLIAQEVETILPELVSIAHQNAQKDTAGNFVTQATDYKTVNYNALFGIMLKGMQEQQAQIKKQDSLITALSNQINSCCSNASARSTSKLNQLDIELSDKNAIVLNQNVPNPFAEQTTITYNVPASIVKAQLLFYNGAGQIIQTVDITTRGKGKVNVFASDLSSGLYHYTLVVDGKVADSKKMVRE